MKIPKYGIIFNHNEEPTMCRVNGIIEDGLTVVCDAGHGEIGIPIGDVVFDCRMDLTYEEIDKLCHAYDDRGILSPISSLETIHIVKFGQTYEFKTPKGAINKLHEPYICNEIEKIHYNTRQISLLEKENVTNTIDVDNCLFVFDGMSTIEIERFVSLFKEEKHIISGKNESATRGIAKFHKVSPEMYERILHQRNWDDFDTMAPYYLKDLRMPQRMTEGSAGYDFFTPKRYVISPGESVIIDTLIRCEISPGWALFILPKSGLGFKYHVMLANTIGLIDEDYYYTRNAAMSDEGHIMIKLVNEGRDILELDKGQAFCQGVFLPYGVTVDDNEYEKKPRLGGIGSTSQQTGDMSSNV